MLGTASVSLTENEVALLKKLITGAINICKKDKSIPIKYRKSVYVQYYYEIYEKLDRICVNDYFEIK